MEKYTELLNELISQFNLCKTPNDLIIAKNVFAKKHLSPLYARLKDLPSEQNLWSLIFRTSQSHKMQTARDSFILSRAVSVR